MFSFMSVVPFVCKNGGFWKRHMKDIRNILHPQIVYGFSDIISREGTNYGHTISCHIHPCLWQHGDHS